MSIWYDPDNLPTQLNGERDSTLISTLGMELVEFTDDALVVRMPVDGRTHQPYGILHGGASVALAETVASWGALLTLDPKESLAVGMEINANHIRPASSGWVYATGTPISRGRTSQIWDIRIANEDGKLVCVSRCTMAIVPADRH
ncbi:hotdog fold thioesterase [Granulicoccus phenolivorans]|uniref:hotdog fold thioesterase n=1 Tax=Granulicoccus phenolivorans TaxID=266854 RepID=UPI00040C1BAD|nr:hotdog fold thioesterase [Granulicoccus phenolivorans]